MHCLFCLYRISLIRLIKSYSANQKPQKSICL